MKLNLGCGPDIRDGYVNIDAHRPGPGVLALDCLALPYDDRSVEEILALDILEHFGRHDFRRALAEWARVLAVGGTLHVRVPDMRALCSALCDRELPDAEVIRRIYGSQDALGMQHCCGFTEEMLVSELGSVGLIAFAVSRQNYNVTIVARKRCM